jgi:hypothetical protein
VARQKGYKAEDLYSGGNSLEYQNIYHQMEVPLLFHFEKIQHSRFSVSGVIGAALALTFGETYKCYDYALDHYVKNRNILRNFNVNLIGGINAVYKVSSNLSLMAGPEGKCAFLSTYAGS